jgi:two-component system chemotaxis response regulator CheB
MPINALDRVKADHVVRLAELPALLETLVHQPAGEVKPVPANIKYEVEVARSGASSMQAMDRLGARSNLACPDCGGVMWEVGDEGLLPYRCHTGHAYTAEMMNLALDENLRRALASALRALEERVSLAEKLRVRSAERGHALITSHWEEKKKEFEHEAGIIRRAIERADEIAARAAAQPESGESLR